MPRMTVPLPGPSATVPSMAFGHLHGSSFWVAFWITWSPILTVYLSPSKVTVIPLNRSIGTSLPPDSTDATVQSPWNFLSSFSRSTLSSAHAPVTPDAAKLTAQNSAVRETRNRFMLHLTRVWGERTVQALGIPLLHLGHLDQIATGVVKNGRGNGPHVHGRLRKVNTRRNEALIFRIHVLDVK